MSAERWDRLWHLFHCALTLPPDRREPFLEDNAGSDPTLADELRTLLAAHEREHSVLDRPPLANAMHPGQRVGAWRLVRELGIGGMGVVWLARRDDGAYDQPAAVKLLGPAWSAPTLVTRFLRERQILAQLNHANIAALLDGGTTPQGLPFLVMEYVDGLPLDEYCRRHELSLSARLRLLAKVCFAVDHAHRQLIVHCDLKPGNILVTDAGEPKLLDFGVAHLLPGAGDAEATLPAERRLTVGYASPEQLRGEAATTAADCYALGVILYQLLCGRRPHRLDGLTAQRALTLLERSPPLPPSRAAATSDRAGGDTRALRGDLDNIALKAVALEADERYTGARELAQDLKRYLEGRPVLARAQTRRYRLGRFVARHAAAVTASAAALVLLIGLTVALAFQTTKLQGALDDAQQQTRRAESLRDFLLGLFLEADPEQHAGTPLSVAELLEQGTQRVGTAFDAQPGLRARWLTTLGRIYDHLGDYARAQALLAEALRLHETHSGMQHPDTAGSAAALALVHEHTGEHAEAESLLRRALAIYQQDPRGSGSNAARVRLYLATTLQSRGRLDEAEAELRTALDSGTLDATAAGDVWLRLGALAWGRGRFDDAEAHYRQAHGELRERHGDRSAQAAKALRAVATAIYRQGRYAQAEAVFRETLEIQHAVYGPEHPRSVETLGNLGAVLFDAGDYRQAASILQRALRIRREIYGRDSSRLGTTLNNLALAEAALKNYDHAERHYREALRINRLAFSEPHSKIAGNLSNLGLLLLERENLDAAVEVLDEALAMQRALYSEPHPETAYTLNHLGRAHVASGRFERAARFLDEARAIRLQVHGEDHPTSADTWMWQGRLALAQGRAGQAARLFGEARRVRIEVYGAGDWRSAEATGFLGAARAHSGERDDGLRLLNRGLESLERERGPDDARVAALRNEKQKLSPGPAKTAAGAD